jgi:formamidopyrimidine-DNA glycosylase
MPELPEVETTRRGLAPHLTGRVITGLLVRQPRLRWPVPTDLPHRLEGGRIVALDRRGKYLLFHVEGRQGGFLIWHLGMSGSLRLVPADFPADRHDHVDLLVESGACVRLRDPRRFGALLWQTGPAEAHPLLAHLGIEPLSPAFTGEWLHGALRNRHGAIKTVLMDAGLIVGVGNIYASEALFAAGIDPRRPARSLSPARCGRLVAARAGNPGTRHRGGAAAACATSSAPMGTRAISSRSTRCTGARGRPAGAAVRASACYASTAVPLFSAAAASAEDHARRAFRQTASGKARNPVVCKRFLLH